MIPRVWDKVGLGASHSAPQGLRRIILCLFTWYVSGSGHRVSMEAPSTPSRPLRRGGSPGPGSWGDVTCSKD